MVSVRWLLLLAVIGSGTGCQRFFRPRPAPVTAQTVEPLAPSPRLMVGRILAVDVERRFAFVDVVADAPDAALTEGAALITRRADLSETGRLRASRYVRGRTAGATIETGQPAVGDEVVWLAP